MLEKDRIDRALDRHRKHQIEEARNSDCDFHRQVLFEREPSHQSIPPEHTRVTAEVLIPIVRNGIREGQNFTTDQGEIFSIGNITKWREK